MKINKRIELQRLIKEKRIEQELSVREFAKLMGCSARIISYWDAEERQMTLDNIDEALNVLGLKIEIGDVNGKMA
ncbi:MAG: helix-turn-helix transcriptional regulator [Anaerovoracaceae bacterium]